MLYNWQDILAMTMVFAAIVYLVRRISRVTRGESAGCGGCSKCPATKPRPDLVSLGDLRKSK